MWWDLLWLDRWTAQLSLLQYTEVVQVYQATGYSYTASFYLAAAFLLAAALFSIAADVIRNRSKHQWRLGQSLPYVRLPNNLSQPTTATPGHSCIVGWRDAASSRPNCLQNNIDFYLRLFRRIERKKQLATN